MIMFPTQNLHKLQQQQQYYYDGYGGCGESTYYTGSFDLMRKIEGYECYSEVCLESDLSLVGDRMAEDGSRTSSVNEAGSSSKDVVQQESRDEKWLQLGLGSGSVTGSELKPLNPAMEPMQRRGGLVELDLLPGSSSNTQQDVKPLAHMFHMTDFRPAYPARPAINTHSGTNISMPLLIHQQQLLQQQQQQPRTSLNLSHHYQPDQIPMWGSYRPNLWNPTLASSSSVPLGSYISRSFQHPNLDIAGPSSDMMMKVVDAPPRPHSGIWFVLQASQNQSIEPFLPQIPKSYLRIKDRRMTVRLLMKYLVNKLRLNSESEVVIRCRDQELEPSLTLQHVRDNIWNSKEMVTLNPDFSTTTTTTTTTAATATTDHVMILHYGRSCCSSKPTIITTTPTSSN